MIAIVKRRIFLISIIITFILGIFNVTYADIEAETVDVDEAIDLQSYSTIISDDVLDNKIDIIADVFNQEVGTNLWAVGTSSASSYDLRDYYDIEVKDQGNTECCWAFALLSSMETNMKIKAGITVDLSEQHMNYATSQSFYDGTNEYGFNREASDGSSSFIGLAYLTNGQGAVLESEMEFTGTTSDISLSDIDIDPSYYVTEYEVLPTIYKIEDGSGNLLYTDGYGTYYSDDEVDALRQIIKEYIVENGAISAYTAASATSYYNNSDILSATAYYCDNMSYSVDHAVTIIGWDDNYSKDNFTGSAKPSSDGAYIVLNSYSSDAFDGGYLYISYEDVWIETMLYGISATSEIDYDNLYQHDEFGATLPISLSDGSGNSAQSVYYASVYSRDASKTEELTKISISTDQYAKFEVYVNSSGDDTNINNMTLVAATDTLNPGYNTIEFDAVELTGDEFAVVVKQTSVDDVCYIMLEAKVDGTMYSIASAVEGDSQVSLDGTSWYNMSDLGYVYYDSYLIDLSTADVCVKAFTTVGTGENNTEEVSSAVYEISSDNYITKIYDTTTIDTFLSNITSNVTYEFVKDGVTVSDYTSYVATGMIFKAGSTSYTLVVRGDLNGDGKITLTDLSKQVLHYVNYEGYILSGAYEKATDINLDGKLSLTDLSQLRLQYVNQ